MPKLYSFHGHAALLSAHCPCLKHPAHSHSPSRPWSFYCTARYHVRSSEITKPIPSISPMLRSRQRETELVSHARPPFLRVAKHHADGNRLRLQYLQSSQSSPVLQVMGHGVADRWGYSCPERGWGCPVSSGGAARTVKCAWLMLPCHCDKKCIKLMKKHMDS